jgi:hypothetical protein
LRETPDNPPRLVALQCAVGLEIVPEHPFSSDDVGAQ